MISQMIRFFQSTIWEIRLKDLSPMKARILGFMRVMTLAVRKFEWDQCSGRASVLTYSSLLNIVPVFAVAFGIAKGFGLERRIEREILEMAQRANWQGDVTNQIIGFSHSLLEHAKGGVIAGIGVVLLFWTIISILGKIEDSFNHIWEVPKSRSLTRKFSDYTAVMVFTPVFFIIASSLNVIIASQAKVIVQQIALLGAFSPLIFFLLNLLPYLSIWAFLTMFYLLLPNTRVPLRSGVLGGIAAGTLYQVVQWVYIKFQIGASAYGAIYGSFAALPLFLVWLQLSWMIFLFGAEIAVASETCETFGFYPDYSKISILSKKLLVLSLFHLLVKKFHRGEEPLSLKEIAASSEIPVQLTRQLLLELKQAGLVAETARGVGHEVAFLPARTIENITVQSTLDAYEQGGRSHIPQPRSEEGKKFLAILTNISDLVSNSKANILLKEIG